MTTAANTTVKQRGRPFRKGESGNPGGRPEGSRNNATLVAERLLQTDIEDVCSAIVTAAKNGDMPSQNLAKKERRLRKLKLARCRVRGLK